MNQAKRLGLIGKNISYSYSKKYFEEKFRSLGLDDHRYDLFDAQETADVGKILNTEGLIGANVTIPYKEKIIKYLNDLSPEAQEIGAVNCIKISNGVKTGYNTDAFGFEALLEKYRGEHHNSGLILGNGGAAKAVAYVLKQKGIAHRTVSRSGSLNFQNLSAELVAKHLLIVQCTPVGTFPHVNDVLDFPFEALTERHLVIDLIYNPEVTEFLHQSKEYGAQTANGYLMLQQQAEKAWEIWRQ